MPADVVVGTGGAKTPRIQMTLFQMPRADAVGTGGERLLPTLAVLEKRRGCGKIGPGKSLDVLRPKNRRIRWQKSANPLTRGDLPLREGSFRQTGRNLDIRLGSCEGITDPWPTRPAAVRCSGQGQARGSSP